MFPALVSSIRIKSIFTDKAQTMNPANFDVSGHPPNDEISVSYRSEQKHQQMKLGLFNEDRNESGHRKEETDVVAVKPNLAHMDTAGVYIIAIVAGISAAATVGLIAVGIGWYK